MVKVRAEDIPANRRIAAFVFLMVADFFYGWSWNTVDVLRPDIRASFELTLTQASLMYTAQSAGALVGAVVIGQLADRLGRRNVLAGIMVGYSLALASGAVVTDLAQLLAHRFVLGLFLGGIFPVAVGIYTGLFDRRRCGRLAGFYNGTFNGSVVVLGFLISTFDIVDWRILLWAGAIPPLLAAPLAFLVVPDDRRTIAYGAIGAERVPSRLPIAELFAPALRWRTLRVATMIGLNFFAYQAFAGWQTTYLQDVRGVPASLAKDLIAWQFGATVVGGFLWGWFADRFGRRTNAIGFVGASALILAYLTLDTNVAQLRLLGLAFGLLLPASVIWGPWLTEMYPPHLRSTAASIFNWGRLISLFSPPVTAVVAERFGLGVAMAMAALSFSLAALIWRTLPETLDRSQSGPEAYPLPPGTVSL
jgi:MFS family permease